MPKYAVLVEGHFDNLYAKTCNSLLRYKPQEVVCCIDSTNAGKTTNDVLNIGGDTPIVHSLESALLFQPDTLLIGIVTEGGYLPQEFRLGVISAITHGLNVVSGLHQFLNDDEEFSSLAKQYNVNLADLRKPPDTLPFTKGSWKNRKKPVLLTVGTDCDSGKMTAAWELTQALINKGVRATFVGTGQTGILLSGSGVAVDAVISDFIAGVVENEIDKVDNDCDIIIVEGQGSLTHMAYSGVTLGLVHGAMPDLLLMCHEPSRAVDIYDHPIYPLSQTLGLYTNMVEIFKPCEYAGISLMTYRENEKTAKKTIQQTQEETNIPTEDLVRFADGSIVDSVLAYLNKNNH